MWKKENNILTSNLQYLTDKFFSNFTQLRVQRYKVNLK